MKRSRITFVFQTHRNTWLVSYLVSMSITLNLLNKPWYNKQWTTKGSRMVHRTSILCLTWQKKAWQQKIQEVMVSLSSLLRFSKKGKPWIMADKQLVKTKWISTTLMLITRDRPVTNLYCNSSNIGEINSQLTYPCNLILSCKLSFRRQNIRPRVLKVKVLCNSRETSPWMKRLVLKIRNRPKKLIICLRNLISLRCFFWIICRIKSNSTILTRPRSISGFKRNLVSPLQRRESAWRIKLMTSQKWDSHLAHKWMPQEGQAKQWISSLSWGQVFCPLHLKLKWKISYQPWTPKQSKGHKVWLLKAEALVDLHKLRM